MSGVLDGYGAATDNRLFALNVLFTNSMCHLALLAMSSVLLEMSGILLEMSCVVLGMLSTIDRSSFICLDPSVHNVERCSCFVGDVKRFVGNGKGFVGDARRSAGRGKRFLGTVRRSAGNVRRSHKNESKIGANVRGVSHSRRQF